MMIFMPPDIVRQKLRGKINFSLRFQPILLPFLVRVTGKRKGVHVLIYLFIPGYFVWIIEQWRFQAASNQTLVLYFRITYWGREGQC